MPGWSRARRATCGTTKCGARTCCSTVARTQWLHAGLAAGAPGMRARLEAGPGAWEPERDARLLLQAGGAAKCYDSGTVIGLVAALAVLGAATIALGIQVGGW